jgi:outer membrane lipoprotein-sorting protein
LGAGEVGGRPTLRFERTLPKDKGYPAHRTIIDLDRETKFPLSVVSYDWSEELLEKYLFDDLRLNAGLTEKDFDRANREYGFGYVTAPIP